MLTGAQELPRTCLRDHFWVEVKQQINSSVSTSAAEFNFSNQDEGHFICALSLSLLIYSTVDVTWLVLCVFAQWRASVPRTICFVVPPYVRDLKAT